MISISGHESTYELELFKRTLKRGAMPVFGVGWMVTKRQVMEAFYAVDPEYEGTPIDEDLFNSLVWESLKPAVEDLGFKIREDDE